MLVVKFILTYKEVTFLVTTIMKDCKDYEKPHFISFITIETTDVQLAEVIFHQMYVQLSCRLADVTQSLGCLFRFSPNTNETGQQEFFVMRGEGGGITVSQCNSQRSAYRYDGHQRV